tara:strand:- start:1048 stop:1311 length:264 start_codon:yes stop_codon:yes gene_type:complete
METLKIEKGIPLPTDTRGDTKYPVFSNMEVGDSVFFPLTEEDNPKRMKNRLAQATRTYGKKQTPEKHFIIRYRLENEISGVRVWRKD